MGYLAGDTTLGDYGVINTNTETVNNTINFGTTGFADETNVELKFSAREDHDTNPPLDLGGIKATYGGSTGPSTLTFSTYNYTDGMQLKERRLSIATTDNTARINMLEGTTATDGIAFGTDVNLYRSAANVLKTDDSMDVTGNLYVRGLFHARETNTGIDAEIARLSTTGDGDDTSLTLKFIAREDHASLPPVETAEIHALYHSTNGSALRFSTNNYPNSMQLKDGKLSIGTTVSSDILYVKGSQSNLFKIERTAHDSFGFGVSSAGGKDYLFIKTGVIMPFFLNADGYVGLGINTPGAKLSFAEGTTAADGIAFGTDVNLYRSAANVLKTDDAFEAGSVSTTAISSATNMSLSATLGSISLTSGYAEDWVSVSNDLKVTNNITLNGRMGLGINTPGAKLSFAEGTTAADGIAFGTDVNLYRSAANVLKTDDSLDVTGNLYVRGLFQARETNTGTDAEIARLSTTGYGDDTSLTLKFFAREDHASLPPVQTAGIHALYHSTNGSALRFSTDNYPNSMQLKNGKLSIGTTDNTARINMPAGTTSAHGIAFGTDVNLYRSAANVLKTDDSLEVGTNVTVGGTLNVTGNISTAGTVDGVDVANHSARHANGGVDEISMDWSQITSGIATGTGNFAGNGFVSIAHGFGVVPSYVFITPSANANGDLGEFWVDTRTSVYFSVGNSGSAQTSFSWIAIK